MIRFIVVLMVFSAYSYASLLSTENGRNQQRNPKTDYTTIYPSAFNCSIYDFDSTETPCFGWTGESSALVVTDRKIYLYKIQAGTWKVWTFNSPNPMINCGVGTTYYYVFWSDDTIYTFYDWQDLLHTQPYVDPNETPLKGYANDDQAMVLTDERIYIHVQGLSIWNIHDYDVEDANTVGGALTSEDALIWTDRSIYFSFGFGSFIVPIMYEDSTETPLYGGMNSEVAYVATDKRIYFFNVGILEPAEIITYADSSETPLGGAVYEELAVVWTNKKIYVFSFSQVNITIFQSNEISKGGGANQSFAHIRTDQNLYILTRFSQQWNIRAYNIGEQYMGGDVTYRKAIVWTDKRIYLLDGFLSNWNTSIEFEIDEFPPDSIGNHYWLTNTALVRTNRKIYIYDCFDQRWEIKEYINEEEPRGCYSRNVLALVWTNKAAYIYDAGPDEKGWYIQPFDSTETPQDGMLGDLSAIIATDSTIYAFFKGATDIGWHRHTREGDDGSFVGVAVSPFLAMMWTNKQIYLCGFDIKTSINLEADITPPENYHLYQNYPNPFNPETSITFYLPQNAQALLQIFNVTGQSVKTLLNAKQPAGFHELSWDGTNENGIHVPSGVYFYRLKADSYSMTKKLLLVR